MMVKALTVLAFVVVAQLLPSCDGPPSGGPAVSSPPDVIGWVDEKRTRLWETTPYLLVINQIEYGTTYEFYMQVDVGDLVKYQNRQWSIVRKATRR